MLFAFGSASRLEALHACCALSKGERWLGKEPSGSGKRCCRTSRAANFKFCMLGGVPWRSTCPACDQSLPVASPLFVFVRGETQIGMVFFIV